MRLNHSSWDSAFEIRARAKSTRSRVWTTFSWNSAVVGVESPPQPAATIASNDSAASSVTRSLREVMCEGSGSEDASAWRNRRVVGTLDDRKFLREIGLRRVPRNRI